MGRLRINSLKYEGRQYYYYNNNFKDGINILMGENGNGKSTFTYLLLYALGNKVEYFEKKSNEVIKEIFSDTDKYVELDVTINERNYILNRKIPSSIISVFNKSNNEYLTFNVVRNGIIYKNSERTFSDWILNELEIDLVEINQYSTAHKLNFDDLFRLMYYDQKTPNSEVISRFGIDVNNFYKTSNMIKRSIFEVLISNFFKEYYETYYSIKKKQKEKEERVEDKKVIELLIDSIKDEFSITEEIVLDERLNSQKVNMEKKEFLRKQLVLSQESEVPNDFYKIERLNQLKEEVVTLISKRNALESDLVDTRNDLNQAFQVKKLLEDDIKYLDKILFTSKFYNVLDDESCPFCFDKIINKQKCICGSDKRLDYEKFIYSDKEYLKIMKSKLKGLDTTKDTIDFCQQQLKENQDNIKILDDTIEESLSYIKEVTQEIGRVTYFNGINQLTDEIIYLKEEIRELELLQSKINDLEIIEKQIEESNRIIDILKLKLEELEEQKNNCLSDNLVEFIKIYDGWLRDFYKTKEINVSLDRNYNPIIGYYQEQSFNVAKRFLYYLSLLNLSLELDTNYPRFIIIDTLKSEGIDLDKLKNLMLYLNHLKGSDFQIIMTSGYEEYPSDVKWNIIDTLNDSDKLLKQRF